jgi:hypothetical protein
MGLIVLILWVGALVVMGLPALALGAWIAVKSRRDRWFWSASALAALVSVAGQYAAVLSPFVRRGMVDWDLVMNAMFGWHLLVAAVAAALVWLAGRWLGGSGVNGAAAGLFASVPLVIALALPVMFTVPSLLHLKFEP